MKIFMAMTDPNIIPAFYQRTKIKLNVMISYHYLRGAAYKVVEKYRDMINLLYLDSGAYTASKENLPITVHEYLGYLKMYGDLFDQVFNLDDKFDDPDHNLANQHILEEGLAGTKLRPIPVIHDTQDPFGEFVMYAELGHDYIAIGSNKKLKDDVFDKMEKDLPNVKVHMFGTLDRKMLLKHKYLYSADSSSYAQAAGLGNILYWDPIDKKECWIDLGEREKKKGKVIHFKRFKHKRNLEDFLLKTFNYDYPDLLKSSEAKSIVNLFFFTQLENRTNQTK
jgi:hypothetical protein